MLPQLFLIFNHRLTAEQEADARASLGVGRFVELPLPLHQLWSNIPPEEPGLADVIGPVKEWLEAEAREDDYVLIQGDFGATHLMVLFTQEKGLIPVYSTTRREAAEERQDDGSVKLVHRFKHVRFRRYGR
jgi:hypothetical protein